jgi:hypothetical protein
MAKKQKLPINIKDRHRWYHTRFPLDQQRIWNFFIKKKGIPAETMVKCLDQYLLTNPVGMRNKRYVLESFYCDFERLLKIVTKETGVVFGMKRHRKEPDTTEVDNAFSLGDF